VVSDTEAVIDCLLFCVVVSQQPMMDDTSSGTDFISFLALLWKFAAYFIFSLFHYVVTYLVSLFVYTNA